MSETKKDALAVAIGLRLRAERHRLKLSLSQLAARTGDTLSKSRISNYEQGIRRIGLEGAVILGRALGDVSPAYLLGLDDSDPLSSAEHQLLARFRATKKHGQALILASAKTAAPRQDQCAQAA